MAFIVSVAGNTGIVQAAGGVTQSPPQAPEARPLDLPALTIPPASSLGVQFVHVATAANIAASGVGHGTVIDNPLTNGKPNAIIIVTPNYNPGNVGGTYDNHPIGVWYSGGTWRIFNQDLAAMPVGAAFNVIIPTAGPGVFVHTVTSLNIGGETTAIDNTLTNANPNAMMLVTPNYNPSGACGCIYDPHPIGVYYSTVASNRWTIFNEDVALMTLGASFNVFVLPAGTGVFVQTATAGNSGGDYTTIDNALTNGNPNAIVFVLQNSNPGGVPVAYNNHNIGVYYNLAANRWRIFNQDIAAVTANTSFNVLVLVPASDVFVHRATAANINAHTTSLDNALTNSHTNAIVFATPNWNPGGNGGTYDNHNIGVYYNGATWAIFNQDGVAMPVNAAFNVLIPNPDTSVFVQTATVANSSLDYTSIDNPLTNGNPGAILFVTPNWNPGNVGGTYEDHPIGVYYTGGKWTVFYQDGTAIPPGAAFNVMVPTARPGVAVFVHTATAASTNQTFLDNPLTNGNPNAIVVVTPNWSSGVYVNFPIGVYYNIAVRKWAIFNQNGVSSTMPVNAEFNVYVDANYKLYLPLVTR